MPLSRVVRSAPSGLCLMKVPCGSSSRIALTAFCPWVSLSLVSKRYITSVPHLMNCQHIVDTFAMLTFLRCSAAESPPQFRHVSHRSFRSPGASATLIFLALNSWVRASHPGILFTGVGVEHCTRVPSLHGFPGLYIFQPDSMG